MRDKNLNYLVFITELRKASICKNPNYPRLLRTAVVNSPTFHLDNFNIVYPKRYHQLRGLVIIHWFLPENFKWRIHLDLWTLNINHLNEKQKLEFSILLSSLDNCMKYLYLSDRFSSHELFGNIIREGKTSFLNLKINRKSHKVILSQRKRGYHDKGSLRSKDKWIETNLGHYSEQKQNSKEKRTDLTNRSLDQIKSYLENLDLI